MTTLEQVRHKIERAKKHIRDLDAERTAFLALNPYKITPEFYVEHNATAYWLDECPEIPAVIPSIAGDAVHNLRSALDYVACELVRRSPGSPSTNGTYFPICQGPEDYHSESVRKTKGMCEPAKQAIDAFKPYRRGNDSLWILHELDRLDKHRLLITSAIVISKIGFTIDTAYVENALSNFLQLSPDAIPKQTLFFRAPSPIETPEKGAMLYSVRGNHEADNHVDFAFDIALREPEIVAGKPIVETLLHIADVVEDLISSFEPFLL